MLLARREPNDVAGADLLDRTAFSLHPAEAGGDDQRLAAGMRMPGGAGTRFERHAARPHRGGCKQGVDPDRSCEPVGWSLRRGLGAVPDDVHNLFLSLGEPPCDEPKLGSSIDRD